MLAQQKPKTLGGNARSFVQSSDAGSNLIMPRALTKTLVLCLGIASAMPISAQAGLAQLDSLILAEMELQHLPGVAAAAIDSGRVVWIGTYGLADVHEQVPVTEDTPFHLASVSKPITATLLLSLWSAGRFQLDDDISEYLPFEVRNPNHDDLPITFRQLLRHRSSIADNGEYYEPLWAGGQGDPSIPLEAYLRDYLSPAGADFDAEKNFLPVSPGAERRYCNTCYALLGYLAEVIAGTPFQSLSRDILFDTLEMNSSAWFLRDLDGGITPALPHRFPADTGFVSDGHNGYPDWPAGQLRSSVRDLARFLAAYASGGLRNGTVVIDPRVVDLMAPADPALGYHTWGRRALRNRQILYSHGGGDAGVRTLVGFQRSRARGAVVLANGAGDVLPIFEEIFLAIDSLSSAGAGNR